MNKPPFYNSKTVGKLRHPDVETAIAFGNAQNMAPFNPNNLKVALLLVDPQMGFIEEGRELCVAGAIDDTRRTIEWIYRNMEKLDYIATSLDTHLPYQIFYMSWWTYADGSPVKKWSDITRENVVSKTIKPLFDFQYEYAKGKTMKWSEYYTLKLAENAKKYLKIWPYHTMLGTPEHAVEPTLYEAIMVHSGARKSQPYFEIKGDVIYAENYSVVETEVEYSGDEKSGLNEPFLNMLEKYQYLYIAGQAKSHCVYETIVSIVNYFGPKAPEVLSRIRILVDCMSPVGGYEQMADEAFAVLVRDYGLKMVKSTDPIG